MQFDAEFITSITELLPVLIPGIFLVGWFLLVLSKHGNLRNMFFWEKLMGRKLEFHDEDFSKAVQEQTELEQLRVFLPNFQFKSIYHAKAVIKWCRENRIGHNQIKGLDNFLECKNSIVSIKQTKSFFKTLSFILFTLFLLTSGASLFVSLKAKLDHSVLAIVKDTHTFVFVYKDRIEGASIFSDPWVLSKNDKNKSIPGGLAVDHIEKLKADLDNGRTVKFVDDNIKINFYSFLFIAIAFFVYTIPPFRFLNKTQQVAALEKQLQQTEVQQESSGSN